MSEVQLAWIERTVIIATSDNLVNSNTHERMVLGGRPVIDIVGPFRRCAGQEQKADSTLELHGNVVDLLSESSEAGHDPLELSIFLLIPDQVPRSSLRSCMTVSCLTGLAKAWLYLTSEM